ncbi:MAG TPA: molybdopterin cofactor-binding domain-containing protein [Bryobacteraceae bacterium]|nr:molybdopterin cofactor-binding domain-containing protein [Bryobacteraceae bacterium]
MSAANTFSRRDLLKTVASAGAALVIAVEAPRNLATAAPMKPVANPLKAWVAIDQSGTVTLTYSKSEMGQGISTSLPMILAEELGVDWKDVQVKHASVDPVYGNQGTGGSGSITGLFTPLRKAGAAGRQMLITAAAARWNVSAESCTAKNGAVWRGSDKLMYGELVEAASQLPVPDLDKVQLKRLEEFEIIGKSLPRTDVPSKVDGSALFGLDMRAPGMVYAVVARCPVFGGKVRSYDATAAKAMKGVEDVFEIPAVAEAHSCGGVVVVARTTWIAMQARNKLKIDWDYGPALSESSETLRRQFRQIVDSNMKVILNQGDVASALAAAPASKRIECDYELPFQAHATMEPMNCTVHIEGDSARVWAPHQAPNMVQGVVARAAGLKPENVQVHTTFMGGGFGRRYQADFPTEAAQIAKRLKKPVQLVWSREDDMTHDFYRPASYHRMTGAVDASGNMTAWQHKYTSTPIAEWFMPNAAPESSELGCTLQMPYQSGGYRLEYTPAKSAVPRAWWRSVEASVVGFVMESFVDELAHSAGVDPLEFRLNALGDARLVKNPNEPDARPLDTARFKGVLQLCAEKANWGTPLPKGEGRGVAVHYSFNSYVANCAEVSVERGQVKVKRIVSAVDIGIPVNPDGIRAQVESAIVYGLTAALKSQITIENGRAVQTNFNKFTTLSMRETPLIEVHIVQSKAAPTGIGEPGLPPTAPALANAIFAATGKRVRRLPIQPGDLS